MRLKALLFLLCIVTACGNRQELPVAPILGYASLKTPPKEYIAGEPIVLEFQESGFDRPLHLLLTNAFGNVVLKGTKSKKFTNYHFPKPFYRVAGKCRWKLLYCGRTIKEGSLDIRPDVSVQPGLETYFGPRSLTAGDSDFSMLVVVPTDQYDNPLPDGTITRVRAQFQDSITEVEVPTTDFIAWNNILSRRQAGRILVGAYCQETDTKELTTIVNPALSEDFKIAVERNHDFADGNQIVRFHSDIIKDPYGNSISDGTLVEFMITDSKGGLLKTMGTTVNGIAKASMLHPSQAEDWKVTAFITGAAKSNTLRVLFKPAISDFSVNFSPDSRHVHIGPLQSFMGQQVPDGIMVRLDIMNADGKQLEQKRASSKKGTTSFYLPKTYFTAGSYRIKVSVAGLAKTFQIQLDEHEIE